jgi:guanylate kinase
LSKAPARGRGRLFVIAAPSGAGKTSLVRALMEREPGLRFSISCTTRQKRDNEVEGRDYFFVSPEEFKRMAGGGEFLEYAQVFDNFYATPRRQVEQALGAGHDLILEIDWHGARQVRAALPDCISIFVLPPSRAELERRLRERGTDTEDVVRRRLRDAAADMTHWREFDYVVVNDDFDRAVGELADIVRGRGDGARSTRPGLAELVATLTA